MSFPVITVIMLASVLATAASAQVPTLNVQPTCQPIGDDSSFKIDKERCLKSELATREELSKQWDKFPVANRKLCTQTASMGGMPSYVALITCLEMKRDAAKLPVDRGLTTQPTGLPRK